MKKLTNIEMTTITGAAAGYCFTNKAGEELELFTNWAAYPDSMCLDIACNPEIRNVNQMNSVSSGYELWSDITTENKSAGDLLASGTCKEWKGEL